MVVGPIRCDGNETVNGACCVDVGDGFLGTFTNITNVMPGGARCALLGCGTKVGAAVMLLKCVSCDPVNTVHAV